MAEIKSGNFVGSSDEEEEAGSEESSAADEEDEEGEEEEDEDEVSLRIASITKITRFYLQHELEFARNMKEEPGSDSGCTAVVALLKGRDLYVANAGDSRCVVSRKGGNIEI